MRVEWKFQHLKKREGNPVDYSTGVDVVSGAQGSDGRLQ